MCLHSVNINYPTYHIIYLAYFISIKASLHTRFARYEVALLIEAQERNYELALLFHNFIPFMSSIRSLHF